MSKDTHYGTVKFFNQKKEFGFITPENGGTDMFVHLRTLEKSGIMIKEGDRVSYQIYENTRNGKQAAENVQLL